MKYLRRIVWYAVSRLFLVCTVLGLTVVVFYYAMNVTNIYVVLKDGMARRAQTVMMMEDGSQLKKYFSPAFIDRDPALQTVGAKSSPYAAYNIRGIDHRLEIGFLWVWPWRDEVNVDVTERIPRIDGRAKGSTAEALVQAGGSAALYPPKWQGARYRAKLRKENDSWHIVSLTLQQVLND